MKVHTRGIEVLAGVMNFISKKVVFVIAAIGKNDVSPAQGICFSGVSP